MTSLSVLARAEQWFVAEQWLVAQSGQFDGPLGPEFGKASPIGLFVIVLALVVVLFLGWRLGKRVTRMKRRQQFAEDHGLDVFDIEAVDKAMKEAGLAEATKRPWI